MATDFERKIFVGAYALMLAMQTEEAAQYKPRFQSPVEKQAIADPKLQRNNIAGKISRFWNLKISILRLKLLSSNRQREFSARRQSQRF